MTLETRKGFSMPLGNKMFFYETSKENKCKSVVDAFIIAICNYREQQMGDDWELTRERVLKDEATRKDIVYRLQKTIYELRETDEKHMQYIYLRGKNFGGGYDFNEIILIEEV